MSKRKVLCTFLPPDMQIYENEILPKFPDLDIQLSSTPLMTKDEFNSRIEGTEGLVHAGVKFPMDEATITSLPSSVKIIANHGAGYDGVAVDAATKRKIWVTNTPDAVNDSTADVTFTLILSVTRRAYEAEKLLREGKWLTKQLNDFMMGRELRGKTLGIIGMGGIGKEVAKRAIAFGMKIAYHNRKKLDSQTESQFNATFCPTLPSLLSLADVLTIHCPLSEETKNLIGKEEIKGMKKGAYLINTSRGKVVNTEALVEGLKSGHLAGAGLDVFETEPLGQGWKELREMENVTLLPHLGTCTIEARSNMLRLCLENVDEALRHNKPKTPVKDITV